jgi:dienelactone hydrolase
MPRGVRNFSPWAYWMLHLAEHRRADPCPHDSPVSALGAWRDRFRARLDALLAPWPEVVPLDVEVVESVDADGYRRERVVFDTEPAMSVPAYLMVPHGRTAPGAAVVAVHGHGPGKDEVCGVGPAASDPRSAYARLLAGAGYVVLAPDLRGFGERADVGLSERYPCDLNLVHATVAGVHPLTQNLWDLMRALDVLAAHPLVDPGRIGAVGFSYGGTMTLFLAACDERVRAAIVSGYFSSLVDAHRVPGNLCGSQVLPGMLEALDHVDLGALVAPRPLLVETGTDDLIFPLAAARRAMDQLAGVYETLGAPDRLEHHIFDGDHRWDGPRAPAFLHRHLVEAGQR